MVILLADAFAPDLPGRLAPFGELTTDMNRVGEAEVIIVRSKTKVDKAMIDKAHKLKYIIRGGVGVDTIDVEYAKQKGIAVDNTPEASSLAVAELAFALMISMPNHIAEADASMKQGKWLKKELERTELGGKTLGLVGIGRIARELAARAQAFGMKVLAYDKYVKECGDLAEMTSLDKLLSTSDFISLHTPLTDETRGMINAASLAKMKKGAYLINTCRGPVVKLDDVVAALKEGRLGGYATDVYDKEPPEGALLTAPHAVLTPHIGASTEENLLRLGDSIVARMKTYTKK